MRKKGLTIIELVTVLVIVTIVSGVFYGLIEKMFESGHFIMGRKDSYQVAREALKLMADEIRWSIRGGDQHNIGMADRHDTYPDAAWQYCRNYPATNTRFVFMPEMATPTELQVQGPAEPPPDNPNPNRRIRFFWGDNTYLTGVPAGWYLRRERDTDDNTTAPTEVRILAAVKDSTKGSLEIRYYDQVGNFIDLGPVGNNVGITWVQASTVGKIELILTVNRWGQPVTLSETIVVREKGRLARGSGYL